MTEYLLAVWGSEETYDTPLDEVQHQFEQVDRFNEKLQADGKWVFAGGLERPSTATAVSPDGILTDGPFSESKEQIGGFWVIKAADLDEAPAIPKDAAEAGESDVEGCPFQGVVEVPTDQGE